MQAADKDVPARAETEPDRVLRISSERPRRIALPAGSPAIEVSRKPRRTVAESQFEGPSSRQVRHKAHPPGFAAVVEAPAWNAFPIGRLEDRFQDDIPERVRVTGRIPDRDFEPFPLCNNHINNQPSIRHS